MATARNDITGAALRTRSATENFRNGWDRIFGSKQQEEPQVADQHQKEEDHEPPQSTTS